MSLTAAQLEASHSMATETLVIAGAGSGKTAVLTERVQWLIDHGASPDSLLILTFTRKAAAEMKARIASQLGSEAALDGAMIGTFHSVALQILRRHGALLGFNTETMTIIDEHDRDILLNRACIEVGILKGEKSWKSPWSREKAERTLEAFYSSGGELPKPAHARDMIRRYRELLHSMNCIDFGTMLLGVNKIFAEHPAVLSEYRNRIKHVLVDELQDADASQYRLHDWFAGTSSFFGVGDMRQTIYGFRGARPDLMQEQHPNAHVFHLSENFRSGDKIVARANAVIAHNPEGDPPMLGATEREGRAWTWTGRTADIVQEIRSMVKAGMYGWSDIAVLARDRRSLVRIEQVAVEMDVPVYRAGGGFDVCDTPEFRRMLSVMRLMVNPLDNLAFMHFAQFMSLTQVDYAEIKRDATEVGCSHFQAARKRYGETMLRLPKPDENAGDVAVSHVFVSEDYFPAAQFWSHHCPNMTVAQALDWFALRDSGDDVPAGKRVTLMTVHKAKGLEWPVVIIANCNEGNFPTGRARRTAEGIEDERRVFYVALTRAREHLIAHWRREEDQAAPKPGKDRVVQAPSRFIAEAGL